MALYARSSAHSRESPAFERRSIEMQVPGTWRHRVMIVVATASFAGSTMGVSSCEKATQDLNDMSGANDGNYRSRIKQLDLGMGKGVVRGIMGTPRDKQVMRSTYGTTEEWYYGSWQLSFSDGKLDAINKY
jgi:hypothetical protein